METWQRRIVAMIFLALTCARSVSAVRILVGGKERWNPNVNYTEWSSNQHFYVGYWLYFVYDRRYYSVLEVNRTDYESCSTDHVIRNITHKAGRDVVQLNESRTYYFISGGGYCWSNMKLSVLVENNPPPPPPAPAPTENGSPPSRSLCRILATVVAWTSLVFYILI
ncbi:hypothetical protein NE237_007228 [Protea cynaroides]|uniref:Phytocyanin domain-containing protein n=1 Tax=Protea cynaroides TaxID=273540 RepID=A0A9Q0QWB0_9MAGN|nr:hypothetical protein NE237_007228 [Protea cynaroides]